MKKLLDPRAFACTLAFLAILGLGLAGQVAKADGGDGDGDGDDGAAANSAESSAPPPGFRPTRTLRAAFAAFQDDMIFMSPEEAVGTLILTLINPFADLYLFKNYQRFYISPMDPDWMKYNFPLVDGDPDEPRIGTRIDLQETMRKLREADAKENASGPKQEAAASGKPKSSTAPKGKSKNGGKGITGFVGDKAYKKMLKEFGTEDAKAKAREKKLRREYFERHTPR